MSRVLHLTVLCMMVLFCAAAAGAAEYFVSPSGNDSNPGTSAQTAWKSIEKVNAAAFKPDDKVLFEGGKKFEGALKFDANDSGSAAKPVTVASYGAGRATIDSGTENGLYAKNVSAFVVKDLIFVGAGPDKDGDFSGISFFADLAGKKPEQIRVDNVQVSGYRWDGISIAGDGKNFGGFRDVRITNAEVHDNGDKGISAGGGQPKGDWVHKKVYVGNCRVYNIRGIPGKKGHTGNGIILSSVDDTIIEYCQAYNNGEFTSDPNSGGPIGIWAWDSNKVVIQFCESYDNKTGNKADGGGFDLDGGCMNCIMQYNYSHGNDGAGYGVYQYNGAREFKNNILRYNISEGDGIKNRHGGIDLWSTNSSGGLQNTKIYNNTIYVSAATNGPAIQDLPDNDKETYVLNTQIYNNIFVCVAGKKLVNIPNTNGGWDFKGNCYWTYGGKIEIKWGKKTYTSVDEWRKDTGQEMLNGKAVGFETDPQLANPGKGGTIGDVKKLANLDAYKLKKSSPLIDTGIDLKSVLNIDAGGRDYYGMQVPKGRGFDIGAYEQP